MIKIAKIAVLEDVKPNLQPIRAKRCQMYCFWTNIIGDELLLNFGARFQRLYYGMRNFCNLIG